MKGFIFGVCLLAAAHVALAQSDLATDFTNPASLPLVTHGNFVTRGTTLVSYTGREKTVTIPDNLGITEIGGSVFGHSQVESVVIPNGVIAIGKGAFASCYSLKAITLPDTVKVIDDNAFNNYSSLITIRIPDSVLVIGASAFYGCNKLARITVPANILYISGSAFSNNFAVSYSNNGKRGGNYVYSRGFQTWYTGTDPIPQAVALTAGKPAQGNGEAWYRIQVPEGGVTLTAFTQGNTDTEIRIYDIHGGELARDDDSGTGYNAKAETFVQAQTCYIKVTGRGPYSITVNME
jgi:hypothetical protein